MRHSIRSAVAATAAFAAALSAAPLAQAAEQPYSAAAVQAAQAAGKPVIIHVTAPWCSTCAAQKPIVRALVQEPKFKDLTVFDVDFDGQKSTVRKYGVRVQSTFVAFKGAKEVGRSSDDTSKASIEKLFDKTS